MVYVPKLHSALQNTNPLILDADERPLASVAMVFSATQPADILLIQRVQRESDPWSGHLAFPGGRVDPGDASRQHAAEREASEEVGLDLARDAQLLGRLDDVSGAGMPIIISAFVYQLQRPHPPELTLQPDEVAAAHWVPLPELLDPSRRTRHAFTWQGQAMKLPAIDLLGPDAPVLWGLTYGFIRTAFHLIDVPLP